MKKDGLCAGSYGIRVTLRTSNRGKDFYVKSIFKMDLKII